jgi:hypothetical protein
LSAIACSELIERRSSSQFFRGSIFIAGKSLNAFSQAQAFTPGNTIRLTIQSLLKEAFKNPTVLFLL